MAAIRSLPNAVIGTRHEYEQVPPQPYSNWPTAIGRWPR
jgi:hypothetical protein